MLEKEFQWYLDNQEELVKKYDGKFIVIKNCKVINDYDDIGIAVEETSKTYEQGTFLVQKCTSGDQDYTATFHSRVA
ncbi:MAG: hypothetical protein IID18_08910 [Nitrospinae bacterium]|nr:hypothetical protein [Nitrospinota bacterium]